MDTVYTMGYNQSMNTTRTAKAPNPFDYVTFREYATATRKHFKREPRIQRVTMDELRTGDLICSVDDDTLTTDEAINESYAAGEQEWATVTAGTTGGNCRRFTYQDRRGEVHQQNCWGDEIVWRAR